MDEFLYSLLDIDIKNILKKYENYALIEIDWVIFGSNGHITQPTYVIYGFTKKAKNSKGFKQICNSDFIITEIGVHEHHAMGKTINISLQSGSQPREIREKLPSSSNPELLINHYQCQSLEFWKNIKMTRGDCDSNLKDDERTLELFRKQDINEIDDFQLKIQNQNMKHTKILEIIYLEKLNELDIIYKNELKLEIKNIEEYVNYYIDILKDVIVNKTFMEIDYNYNNSLTTDLIRNKWKGFVYTTNQIEYKDKYDIFNTRYSQIKFELIQNNLQLVNCDLLYLVNNLDLINNI